MKLSIREIKNRIKSEPIILLKKPWLVFLIPMILVYVVFNRFKRSEIKVYLTDTKLSELSSKNRLHSIGDNFIHTITNYNRFDEYVQKRIIEDCSPEYPLVKITKDRFDRGDFAIVYTDQQGAVLSYVFICTKVAVFTPVGIDLQLPAHTFGMYDVYTYQDSRGKGHYSNLFYYAVDLMQSKGYDSMWLWLMSHNSISVRVHYKLGIKIISKILTEKVVLGLIRRDVGEVKMSLAELISNE